MLNRVKLIDVSFSVNDLYRKIDETEELSEDKKEEFRKLVTNVHNVIKKVNERMGNSVDALYKLANELNDI
jgi:hypothetical protein